MIWSENDYKSLYILQISPAGLGISASTVDKVTIPLRCGCNPDPMNYFKYLPHKSDSTKCGSEIDLMSNRRDSI